MTEWPGAAGAALLMLAGWVVWRPVETFPATAVLAVAVVLALTVWGWRRTPAAAAGAWLTAIGAFCVLLASGLMGWDPAASVTELALAAAVTALIWLASREAPPERWPAVLALVISGLALWGMWQVGGGLDHAAAALDQLPGSMREAAAHRLASGRAFASLLLPSHLAVLFATALPLLLARIFHPVSTAASDAPRPAAFSPLGVLDVLSSTTPRPSGRKPHWARHLAGLAKKPGEKRGLVQLRTSWNTAPWAVGSALCVIGLVLTRSPIGAALGLLACIALAAARGKGRLVWVALVLAIVLAIVVVGRGDVMELEPVRLRLDNWRTALWVWSTAPAAGVGIGGFAQAAQSVPFGVGNRPLHAHSLPLELLAELGPAGCLMCLLGAIALWRLVRDLWPRRPDLAVAVMVVPLHNLVDFSFFDSAVVLPWAVLAGWAAAFRIRGGAQSRAGGRGRVFLVLSATLALALTVLHGTSQKVEESAATRPTAEERMAAGLEACRLAPWRVAPVGLVARSAIESGDRLRIAVAAEKMESSRWLRPRSSALALMRSQTALTLGEIPTGVSEAWSSRNHNPSSVGASQFVDDLFDRLDRGTDRAQD